MFKSFGFTQMKTPKEIEFSKSFKGGLNVTLPKNKIADNESPDLLNFYKEGERLTLRPGIAEKFEYDFGRIIDVYPKNAQDALIFSVSSSNGFATEKRGIYIAAEKGIFYYDGVSVFSVSRIVKSKTAETISNESLILTEGVFVPSGKTSETGFTYNDETYTVLGEKILFVGSGYYFSASPEKSFESPNSCDAAVYLRDVEPYVPTVLSGCSALGVGTKSEDHNILTKKCRQMFTTDGTSLVYTLCDEILEGETVTLDYTGAGGAEYQLLFTSLIEGELTPNIKAKLNIRYGILQFSAPLIDAKSENLENNLVISYSRKNPDENSLKHCSSACFFNGGDYESTGSGRLFLSSSSEDKNKIFCSVPSDPTYFPEESSLSVGLSNEKITAIMPQSSSLAVFKENSVFLLDYYKNSFSAQLNFYEINPSLGCPVAKTLKRVKNFLVFFTKKGVYALNLSSAKDERATVLLSKKIDSLFSNFSESELQNASAASDGKNYYLFIKTCVFVMNYENINLTTSKRDDSVSWFLWELPFSLSSAFLTNFGLAAFSSDFKTLYNFKGSSTSDCGSEFEAFLISKTNDFDLPKNYKRIIKVLFSASGESGGTAEIFIDLDGEEISKTVTLNKEDFEETFEFCPSFNLVKTASFGVKRQKGCEKRFFVGTLKATALQGPPQE